MRAARPAHAFFALVTLSLLALLAACSTDPAGSCSLSTDCAAGQTCVARRCQSAADSSTADIARDTSNDSAFDATMPPPDDRTLADTGPLSGAGCSADLRDVLDGSGLVLRTCPPDQGCNRGTCIAACDAAAASRGSVGCGFSVTSPPAYPPALPPCLAVFLANTWPRGARITVTRGGTSFDATMFGRIVDNARPVTDWAPVPATGIPEGQVAVLFLSSDPNSVMPENNVPLSCPITPAVNASTVIDGSGLAQAFRITTDVPVSAYDILPYGGARSHFPSAQLLLPSSAWGVGYVVISPPPGTYATPGPQWINVVALEDDTHVRVRPTVDLPAGGTLPAIARGSEGTVTLSAGQYLQWELPRGAADPSGTLVSADRAVGLFSGNRFLRLQRMPAPGGESTHQQLLPVDALSNVYVGAPYETRRADLVPEPVPYRLVGAVDGTRFTFDPPIAGAPVTLDRGAVADFDTDVPFIVSSQDTAHPFAVAQMMSSANVPGASRPGAVAPGYGPWLGDEEFVVMFPPAQYLSRYVFFSDPAYATTNLVIVRVRTATGFKPVNVDCIGNVTGFRAVGSSGQFEMTTVDLVRADVGVGPCTDGRHVAHSEGPFGVVVWGLDSYSSYAYPAGGNAATLVDIPL